MRLAIAIALLVMPLAARANIGVVVRQHISTSITGRPITVCVYSVGGQEVEVVKDGILVCPVSMNFR